MGVNDVQSETDVSQKGKGAHLQNAEFAATTCCKVFAANLQQIIEIY